MTLKGTVSSIENGKARVIFNEHGNMVSPLISVANHVGALESGDNVAVIFFSGSMVDGLIIAKF